MSDAQERFRNIRLQVRVFFPPVLGAFRILLLAFNGIYQRFMAMNLKLSDALSSGRCFVALDLVF